MAGIWRQRAIALVSALVGIFAIVVVIDTFTGGSVFQETVPGSGDDQEETASLEATGTTLGSGTQPSTTEPEPESAALSSDASVGDFEAIRNRQDKFVKFATTPSAQLDIGALTEAAPVRDNGASPDGQFRVACEYSHFGYDDPIIFPGRPGESHLHMFFGNTETDAFTTEETLVDSGGGTCSGFELNRSAYWTPALLDGSGNIVVPDQIIIYYKTKFPDAVNGLPQGLQMLAGNFESESFEHDQFLLWSCGPNGNSYNHTNRIPDCGGDVINAGIQFPNCWDGVNLGSDDFVSHLTFADDVTPCPASHPVRMPQISILLYYPGADSVDGWRLSSDDTSGFNGPPGGTLHADWWGGWNDETMDLWINGCMKAARNCSFGQTGGPRQLAGLNALEIYEGENYLPMSAG